MRYKQKEIAVLEIHRHKRTKKIKGMGRGWGVLRMSGREMGLGQSFRIFIKIVYSIK